MKILKYTSLESIESQTEPWLELWERNPSKHPCMHPSWLKLWYAHYIQDVEPLLIFVLDDTRSVRAIAPMMRLKKDYHGFSVGTVMLAAYSTVDYADILFDDVVHKENALKAILEKFNGERIVFQNLREDSQARRTLNSSRDLWFKLIASVDAPYLHFEDMGKNGVDGFISKERKRVLRKRLRISDSLDVVYFFDRDLRDIDKVWFAGQSAELQKQGLMQKNIVSNFTDPRVTCFYIDLLEELHRLNMLSISYAVSGDRLVAFQVAMKTASVYYAWITAYSREFSRASPSVYIMYSLVKKYENLDYIDFDFMKGEESYKSDWCTRKTNVANYSVGLLR